MTIEEWKYKWATEELSIQELDEQAQHLGASVIRGINQGETSKIWNTAFFNAQSYDHQLAETLMQAEADGLITTYGHQYHEALSDLASDTEGLNEMVTTSFDRMMPKSIHPENMMRVAAVLGPEKEEQVINDVAKRDTIMQAYLGSYITNNISEEHMEELSSHCDAQAQAYCKKILQNYDHNKDIKETKESNAAASNMQKAIAEAKAVSNYDTSVEKNTIAANDIEESVSDNQNNNTFEA